MPSNGGLLTPDGNRREAAGHPACSFQFSDLATDIIKMLDKLFILGTGVLAEECFALASHAGIHVAAFIENMDRAKSGTRRCDRPILWVDDMPQRAKCICALSTSTRSRFIDQVSDRAEFVNLVHPSSIVLPGSTLGRGAIISAGVIVASNTAIGDFVFVNRAARLGHHTQIGKFATIQPGANIAGLINIGESTLVGMGSIIIERLTIGRESIIAAGAVVICDVPDNVMVAGNPAVVKKTGIVPR